MAKEAQKNSDNSNGNSETNPEFEKAKKFSKSVIGFFETIKTVKKIAYLAAILIKIANPTVKQEITRFCLEWIRQYPITATHPAMNDSVKFCNGVKRGLLVEGIDMNINNVKFEKIIVTEE